MKNNKFNAEIISLEPSLTRYAYVLTLNADDTKDLVQETYFKALSNEDKFDADTNMKAWLYTIMRNTFINDYRRRLKSRLYSVRMSMNMFLTTGRPKPLLRAIITTMN